MLRQCKVSFNEDLFSLINQSFDAPDKLITCDLNKELSCQFELKKAQSSFATLVFKLKNNCLIHKSAKKKF